MSDALLADLRALAEKWKRPGLTCEPWDDVTDDLLDLIAKHTPKPNKCAECGHAHTPMGCTGDPTPSDLWAGVTPAACDCEPDVSERTWIAKTAAELVRTSAVSYSEALEALSKLVYSDPPADERDELARVIGHAYVDTGAQPALMADAILSAGWRRR